MSAFSQKKRKKGKEAYYANTPFGTIRSVLHVLNLWFSNYGYPRQGMCGLPCGYHKRADSFDRERENCGCA